MHPFNFEDIKINVSIIVPLTEDVSDLQYLSVYVTYFDIIWIKLPISVLYGNYFTTYYSL